MECYKNAPREAKAGEEFVLVNADAYEDCGYKKGDIIELKENDGSDIPIFWCKDKIDCCYVEWQDLAPLPEPTKVEKIKALEAKRAELEDKLAELKKPVEAVYRSAESLYRKDLVNGGDKFIVHRIVIEEDRIWNEVDWQTPQELHELGYELLENNELKSLLLEGGE